MHFDVINAFNAFLRISFRVSEQHLLPQSKIYLPRETFTSPEQILPRANSRAKLYIIFSLFFALYFWYNDIKLFFHGLDYYLEVVFIPWLSCIQLLLWGDIFLWGWNLFFPCVPCVLWFYILWFTLGFTLGRG